MSVHADYAQHDHNQPVQPMLISHIRVSQNLVHRYCHSMGIDPLKMITGRTNTRSLAASYCVFSDNIRAKYAFGEMQKPRANAMIYRKLGSTLSVAYSNIHMTVPLSVTIRPVGEVLSPSFWISRPTTLSFPIVVNDRLPVRPISLERQVDRAVQAVGSDAARLGRFKNSGISTGAFLALLRQRTTNNTPAGLSHPHLVIANGLTGRGLSATSRQVVPQLPAILMPMPGFQPQVPLPTIQPAIWQVSTPGAQDRAPQPVGPDVSRQRSLLHRFHASSTPGQQLGHHTLSRVENQQTERPLPMIGWHPSAAYDPRLALERRQARAYGPLPIREENLTPLAPRRAATPWLGARSTPSLAATDPIFAIEITEDMHRMTVIRREVPSEPPQLSYPLVQPPVTQKAQVVTTIREQEVVNVVRNEIQSYMASGSPLKRFSRSDYAHIADHVYSSLTRRLLVEKERLGLR